VDKIFEEGLKGAQAIILVLSRVSVEKPWVREELNAAIVKRINTGSRLIPVVIDECEIPEALKSTLWQRMQDPESDQEGFDRVLASIFGTYDKPPLGAAPAYSQRFTQSIGSLTNVDSLVLRLACEEAIASGSAQIDSETVYVKDGKPLLPLAELKDAIEVLEQQNIVQAHHVIGGGLLTFQITTYGFEEYAQACIQGYEDIVVDVASALVNRQKNSDQLIAADLNRPLFLVQHILQVLEAAGHLSISNEISGPRHIYNVAASLRRALASS
jgi:hypothetical protein